MSRGASDKRVDPKAIAIFKKLRAQGLTLKIISMRTGFSTSTISKVLKDAAKNEVDKSLG